MSVEELRNNNEWDEFLRESLQGTFYHSLKWKEVIEKSFSYRAHYLVVKNGNGKIIGICPAFIRKYGGLKIYTSMPHSDFGGPIIKESYVEKSAFLLKNFIEELCFEQGISCAEIYFSDEKVARFFKSSPGYVDSSRGVMFLDLKVRSSDIIWKEIFSGKQRYEIKRFERNGFCIREASTKSDLREFYRLYLDNMRHLDSYGNPYSFFRNIWDLLFPKNFNMLLLEKGKCLGGLAQFKYEKGIYGGYVAIDRQWNWGRYSMMPYMIWKLISWAEENGFRYISLGSTPSQNANAYHIQKSNFGAAFLQQEKVTIPFSFNAKVYMLAKTKAIPSCKQSEKFFPINFELS
ncbi:MAG: GNAT family N-acetyltransferase [Candidatus Bathyarchaeota archaeon]|nr:GNAT family N-acetyltransferase [Candidatus Bathyarchaeota archaeon]